MPQIGQTFIIYVNVNAKVAPNGSGIWGFTILIELADEISFRPKLNMLVRYPKNPRKPKLAQLEFLISKVEQLRNQTG